MMSKFEAPSDDDSVSLLCEFGNEQSRGAAHDMSSQCSGQLAADKVGEKMDWGQGADTKLFSGTPFSPGCQRPSSVSAQTNLRVSMKSIHKKNCFGETQLHKACKRRDVAAVKALIRAGIDVNREDNAGWTSLHEACKAGDETVVEELLKAGANISANSCDGVTPFHDAVLTGNGQLVMLLLRYGSNPEDKTVGGLSAFDMAETDSIKQLLSSFKQIQTTKCHKMLAEIHSFLTKMAALPRMEKEKLTQSYWKMSDALRQRVLKKQLLSLANCQRTLIELLKTYKDFVDSFAANRSPNHPSSVNSERQQADPTRAIDSSSCSHHNQQRSDILVSARKAALRQQDDGEPTHAKESLELQQELSTDESIPLQDVLNIRYIYLIGDDERLPNAQMNIYWERLLQRDPDDWSPL